MKRAMRDILLLVVLLVQTSCIDNLLDYPGYYQDQCRYILGDYRGCGERGKCRL